MSRLNVFESPFPPHALISYKGKGLSGIDTSKVFVMVVCVCGLNKLFPVLLLKLQCHVAWSTHCSNVWDSEGVFGKKFIFIQQICV